MSTRSWAVLRTKHKNFFLALTNVVQQECNNLNAFLVGEAEDNMKDIVWAAQIITVTISLEWQTLIRWEGRWGFPPFSTGTYHHTKQDMLLPDIHNIPQLVEPPLHPPLLTPSSDSWLNRALVINGMNAIKTSTFFYTHQGTKSHTIIL